MDERPAPRTRCTREFAETDTRFTPAMSQLRPVVPTAESPCIKICQLDLDDRCRGCGRTLDEIREWSGMSMAQRIAVNERLGFVSHERRR